MNATEDCSGKEGTAKYTQRLNRGFSEELVHSEYELNGDIPKVAWSREEETTIQRNFNSSMGGARPLSCKAHGLNTVVHVLFFALKC